MVMHSAVTPESSGRGLSHSTFFTFYATTGCAAKMPLAITQLQLEVRSHQVIYFEVSKASVYVAAPGTIQAAWHSIDKQIRQHD